VARGFLSGRPGQPSRFRLPAAGFARYPLTHRARFRVYRETCVEIIVAIIGGLFSLAGIWLTHQLATKRQGSSSRDPIRRSRSQEETASVPYPKREVADRGAAWEPVVGLILLGVAGLAMLMLFAEPGTPLGDFVSDEIGWFILFAGGASLVGGVYLLASSLIGRFRR
jgi:hypothetical protein